MIFESKSPGQTKGFAKKIARQFINRGGIIALTGDPGAGKTTFSQGFAEGLGIKEKVISPTFILIRQYEIPNHHHAHFTSKQETGHRRPILAEERINSFGDPLLNHEDDTTGRAKVFYHLDLYRLEDKPEADQLGIQEILEDPENIILIEWAEKILDQLPKNSLKITFTKIPENIRQINLKWL